MLPQGKALRLPAQHNLTSIFLFLHQDYSASLIIQKQSFLFISTITLFFFTMLNIAYSVCFFPPGSTRIMSGESKINDQRGLVVTALSLHQLSQVLLGRIKTMLQVLV